MTKNNFGSKVLIIRITDLIHHCGKSGQEFKAENEAGTEGDAKEK